MPPGLLSRNYIRIATEDSNPVDKPLPLPPTTTKKKAAAEKARQRASVANDKKDEQIETGTKRKRGQVTAAPGKLPLATSTTAEPLQPRKRKKRVQEETLIVADVDDAKDDEEEEESVEDLVDGVADVIPSTFPDSNTVGIVCLYLYHFDVCIARKKDYIYGYG